MLYLFENKTFFYFIYLKKNCCKNCAFPGDQAKLICEFITTRSITPAK